MIIISGEDIKQAVAEELLKIDSSVRIYKESQSRILYPHFFINQISVSDTEDRKHCHFLDFSMNVRYRNVSDPSTDLKLEQSLDNMALKLMRGFNVIKFESSYARCYNKTTEKVDGVLHFNFNIKLMVKEMIDESIKQEKLNLEVKLSK